MLFDQKGAEKELKKYKKKGAGKATRKLIKEMLNFELERKSLLDIGGGVGAIQWAFLKYKGNRTIDIDASQGYLKVATEYATEQGYENNKTKRSS